MNNYYRCWTGFARFLAAGMIASLAILGAVPGWACQQPTPPPESPDAYFDSEPPAGQAAAVPAPNGNERASNPTRSPATVNLGTQLQPKSVSPPGAEASGSKLLAPNLTQMTGATRSAATRTIDQLAAQATQGNVTAPSSPPATTPTSDSAAAPGSDRSAAAERDTFEPGRVLAIVGGRPILVGDMLYEINERIEQVIPTAPDAIKEQQRVRLYSAWLTKFIDQQLLYTDVVRALPAEADVSKMFESIGKSFDEEALPEFLKKQKLDKPVDFDIYLRSHGSSLRKFRQRWIEDQFVKYFMSQKFAKDYEPTHAEMWEYYQKHRADYAFPARARWEQLVIRFDKVPDKSEARRQIAELGNKVVYGASLAAVAKESSHDSKASEGGQQGWVNQGSLADRTIDSTLFAIPVGELSDILESAIGFHIVRVQERVDAGAKPFRDAQPEIKDAIAQQHRTKQVEEYLTKLRKEIPIEIIDPNIKLPEGFTVR